MLGKRIRPQTSRRVGSGATVKTFKCHLDSCGKIFNDRASLKKHMTVHGDKLVSFRVNPYNNSTSVTGSSSATMKAARSVS